CAPASTARRTNSMHPDRPRTRAPLSARMLLTVPLLAGCVAAGTAAAPEGPGASPYAAVAADDGPPPVAREFRGVWIAAVANMDWPSAPGLSPDSQRAELISQLDRSRELGLNAIVLHIRPAADALYASDLEPWSAYLT